MAGLAERYNTDLECALRRLESYLDRYRSVADPASYHSAANTLQALRAEAETETAAEAQCLKVKRFASALRRAVLEWQDGRVP